MSTPLVPRLCTSVAHAALTSSVDDVARVTSLSPSLAEFFLWTLNRLALENVERLQELFSSYDTDRTGFIDMREFRANLPSLLHLRGLETVPRTLEVGDFVLTPQLCIERKSLSDLFGSFGSGRLFKQAESMARHYQLPTLLVEFAQGQAFALRSEASIGNDISPTSITSKMVLLLLHCPQLRLLWSRNPHMTVNLFCALKDGQPEADVEAAFMAGRPEGEDGEDESCMLASQEMLRRLPGVTAHNYHTIMRRVRNMVELTKLSERQLIEMIGKAHGRRLWMFLHKNKTLPS